MRKLIVVSAPCRRDAWFPETRAAFDGMSSALFGQFRQSSMYEEWAKVAPDPNSFPVLMDKTGGLLRQPYDWSDEVKGLPMPVLLAYADADSIPPSHAAEFFALLGGGQRDADWDGSQRPASRLAILPGHTHYDIGASPLLASVADDFLAASLPGTQAGLVAVRRGSGRRCPGLIRQADGGFLPGRKDHQDSLAHCLTGVRSGWGARLPPGFASSAPGAPAGGETSCHRIGRLSWSLARAVAGRSAPRTLVPRPALVLTCSRPPAMAPGSHQPRSRSITRASSSCDELIRGNNLP